MEPYEIRQAALEARWERQRAALAALCGRYDLLSAEDPAEPFDSDRSGECGEGWLPLLEELFSRLIDLGWKRQVSQIKQKHGGLRVYVRGWTPAMAEVIRKCSARSFSICDLCGRAGQLRRLDGRFRTRCDEHRDDV